MTLGGLLMLLLIATVFTPLERLRPAHSSVRSWATLRVDALHIFVSGALIRWGSLTGIVALGLLAAAAVPHPLREAVRAQPIWLATVEVLLLSDLCFYAAHRLFHAVPWLWRFHEIHHSSERLDWIATHRVHPVDQVVNALIIAAPAVLLGFQLEAVLIYSLIYRWHAILLHSNVRIDFGPLRWIVASPLFHHWHHANQPDAYDRNFGGQLVIFDWLFGTLNLRSRELPVSYGLSEPIPQTYLGQLAHPFRTSRPASVLSSIKEPA